MLIPSLTARENAGIATMAARLNRASRGYKDINLLACQLLRPGGVRVTFSCSGLLEPALFQKIVADAALDAGRDAQILHRLVQSADHPVLLSFPEGAYLKGLNRSRWRLATAGEARSIYRYRAARTGETALGVREKRPIVSIYAAFLEIAIPL